ncbi:hypothetical protein Tsubulata_029660, partial [Turnera subulata]
FLVLAILIITLSLLGHCSTVVLCDDNLIQQTCKQTPNPALCVSSLKSNPQSTTAELTGLAVIMINVVKAKAGETSRVIKQQLSSKPELKHALTNCDDGYNAILVADIPSSIQAVQLGNPKFGETGMNDAANEASSCEDGFGGKSTISRANKIVHETSSIAAAIPNPTAIMNSMSNVSLILLHAILITIFLLGHCSTVARCDGNLIVQTCKLTPNTALCVSSLKADPQSSKADLKGLAVIMIEVVKAKARGTSQVIKQQLTINPKLKRPLTNCASGYDAILTADIPSSIQAVQLGDPKFGVDGMTDAANEARYCEDGFGGKSTISRANQVVHETSSVAAAIWLTPCYDWIRLHQFAIADQLLLVVNAYARRKEK